MQTQLELGNRCHYLQQEKSPLGSSSIAVVGVPATSPLFAINELVPGDSGGKTAFVAEVLLKTWCGMAGSGGEMAVRYCKSICII